MHIARITVYLKSKSSSVVKFDIDKFDGRINFDSVLLYGKETLNSEELVSKIIWEEKKIEK
jgi:hypothetical protein